MSTFISDLSGSSLARQVRLELFNTGKTTIPGRPLHQGIRSRLALLHRWWKLLSSTPRAIVHIHTCSGLTFWLDGMLLVIARLRRHATVLHIHGGFFDTFLDGLSAPMLFLARRLARSADRVVVLSREWHDKLSPRLKGASLSIVINGVPPIAPGVHLEGDGEQIHLLFLGGFCKEKGLLELLATMPGLPHKVRLVLAGFETEAGFMARLREECSRLLLDDRVRFAGAVSGEAKKACFRNADLFVLPSYAEGLPISLLEAMAAGLPVVATKVGGIPTALEDGVQGRLVPPRNVEQLRQAIEELSADAEMRERMGQAAFQRWAQEFSIERSVEQILALYGSLARKGCN